MTAQSGKGPNAVLRYVEDRNICPQLDRLQIMHMLSVGSFHSHIDRD